MNLALAVAPAPLRGVMLNNEPMSKHTSWRVGGKAEYAYIPADLADLTNFMESLPHDEPVHFVGLGSNLLVRDGGVRGTVILLHGALNQISPWHEKDGEQPVVAGIYAEAGVASPKVARYAALNDLQGAEFLAGIPGTMGGALAMNAGCYGAETWGRVAEVLTIDRFGQLRRRTPKEYVIGYRHATLKESGEEWFVAAWLRFSKGDGQASREKMRELLEKRVASQPLSQPNAGSVFRNPPGDHAARLIEATGLKGMRLGGAEVSQKHANFIVNTGTATAGDIEALITKVQDRVMEKHGVALVREVRIIGETA
ncbi:MAG: UDP-N-acetylmuramate dehydrogenase [Sulfuricella sp.]|nr:UDP-N-acetylmuramate dehydrogenase [Sulfuricella sp.]